MFLESVAKSEIGSPVKTLFCCRLFQFFASAASFTYQQDIGLKIRVLWVEDFGSGRIWLEDVPQNVSVISAGC